MCSLQRNYDVIRNWARFETGPLTGLLYMPWDAFFLDMFILTNSVDPEKMPHYATSHLGPYCL